MLSNSSKNVALTFEQLEQIETAKGILKNIEAETAIANKNLSVLQKEVIKATKEREYQEELVASFSEKSLEKKAELDSLSASVEELKKEAAKTKKESEEQTRDTVAQIAEIQSRREALEASELAHKAAKDAFAQEVAQQEKDRADIEKAQEAFKEALTFVTW